MALKTGGGLQTLTLVLTEDQVRRIRALTAVQNAGARRTSMSDVGRDVVERGLDAIVRASNTDSNAIGMMDTEGAAA